MTDDMQDQEFVEYVLKTVVDNPDDVHVDRTIDEMGVLLSVNVNPDDMGKVIGKSGQTAKAIRTLLKVVGAKHDARVNMKIIEPEGGNGRNDSGGDAAPEAATPAVAPAAADFGRTDQNAAPAQAPRPGTTDAADDVPADERSEDEAVAAQHETDAAMPQPVNDNSEVDEATGNPAPNEPHAASEPPIESTPAASQEAHDQALHEKSPLDEL